MALQMFLLVVAFASLLAPQKLSAFTGFRAMLKHVDHGRGLAPAELFKRAVQRTKTRQLQKRQLMGTSITDPIFSGHGEFLINLAIGTPPEYYSALIDTDTDLIWTICKSKQCDSQKMNCSNFPAPVLDPSRSSTYSKIRCKDNLCKQMTNSSCNSQADSCTYNYQYSTTDGASGTQGDLATETFSFSGKDSVSKLAFGCANALAQDLEGLGSGFVGLGRGIMSLPSQMKLNKFSHCLPSYDYTTIPGVLAFGSGVKIRSHNPREMITADMVPNPIMTSSYYVSLKGIKVNGKPLNLDTSTFQIKANGQGGMVIDSGMTLSYIEESAYSALRDKLTEVMNSLEPVCGEEIGFDLCYDVPASREKYLPSIAFTLGNGQYQTDLVLSKGNAFRKYDGENGTQITCLAMAPSPDYDAVSRLGNIQMQNTIVLYDLVGKKISFLPNTQCDKL